MSSYNCEIAEKSYSQTERVPSSCLIFCIFVHFVIFSYLKIYFVIYSSTVFTVFYIFIYLRNKFDFWIVHGIMNTSDLLQSK